MDVLRNKTLLFSLLSIFLLLAVPSTAMVPGLPDSILTNTYSTSAVMHLPFDENTGSTANNGVDSSVNNGIITGATWIPGRTGSGLQGPNVNAGNDASLNITSSISLEAYIDETTGSGAIIDKSSYFLKLLEDDTINFGLRGYNDGTTWTLAEDTTEVYIYSLAVFNGALYAGTGDGGQIYRSTDGTTWTLAEDTTESGIRSLAVFNGALYAGTSGSGQIYCMGTGFDIYAPWGAGNSFIQAEYDGTTAELYINDVLAGSKSSTITIDTNSYNLSVGNSLKGEQITGLVDEVAVGAGRSAVQRKLSYYLGADNTFDILSPTIRQIIVPILDLFNGRTAAKAKFTISTSNSSAWIPVPISTDDRSELYTYGIDGDIITFSDNKYVASSSVNVLIPITVHTPTSSEIPTSLFLDYDENVKTFTYSQTIKLSNPSDIAVVLAPTINTSIIGAGKPLLNGNVMSLDNSTYKSVLYLGAGETKTMNLTAATTLTKQDVEFLSTYEDFLEIDTYAEAATMAENALAGKMDTKTRTIFLETTTDMTYNNRSVIIPLKVDVNDVIEAKALSGSKELLEVRQGASGAELVIPESAWNSTSTLSTAQAKVIYNKEPSWYEGIPGLSAMGGFFETLKNLFGGA